MINQIKEDMKQAMRDKDKVKLSTLRMLITTLENERINKKVDELEQDDVYTCINRNLKQLDQEVEAIIKADRELGTQEEQRKILQSYLPLQLGEEEIRQYVQQVMDAEEPVTVTFGQLMKALSDLKGMADMKIVSKVAKEMF